MQAFNDALTNAETLLALAELNIAALQVRALAGSGWAAATDDPIRATQAVEAFTQLHRATRAAGVVADSFWLLDAISSALTRPASSPTSSAPQGICDGHGPVLVLNLRNPVDRNDRLRYHREDQAADCRRASWSAARLTRVGPTLP